MINEDKENEEPKRRENEGRGEQILIDFFSLSRRLKELTQDAFKDTRSAAAGYPKVGRGRVILALSITSATWGSWGPPWDVHLRCCEDN